MSQTTSAEASTKTVPRPIAAAMQAAAMVSVLAESFVLTDSQADVLSEVLASYIAQNANVFPLPAPVCADQIDSIFFFRRPSLQTH